MFRTCYLAPVWFINMTPLVQEVQLSDIDIDKIAKNISNVRHKKVKGMVGGGEQGKEDRSIRVCDVLYLNPLECRLSFNILQSYLIQNARDIIKPEHLNNIPSLQYAYYTEGGFFKKHKDVMGEFDERLYTIVLQLSDPREYAGCDLLVYLKEGSEKDIHKANKQRGSITIFPSFLDHQVTELTKGEREALVCWIMGSQVDMWKLKDFYNYSF